jgi:uncharacterized protein YcaQ
LLELSLQDARRLSVNAQLLAGPRPRPTREGLLQVARTLRCIQIDAVAAPGASTQYLVPFSRLGPYDRRLLDRLVFDERVLFHYLAHALSLVLTEDFQLFAQRMRPYASRKDTFGARVGSWMRDNRALREKVLDEIARRGPLRSRDFVDSSRTDSRAGGWTEGRSVNRMLDFLWVEGLLAVAGRNGSERLWDLSERWFPDWTPREPLPAEQRSDLSVEHSLRALGVARAVHVSRHFTRNDYPDLQGSLGRLRDAGQVLPVRVAGGAGWYLHRDSLALLEAPWKPQVALLSPFDNLIADRARTRELFGFDYTIEIYVPAAKRRRGYYAMPILSGDRLIGSADVRLDRSRRTLAVGSLIFEPGFRPTAGVQAAIRSLARFVGALEIDPPPGAYP